MPHQTLIVATLLLRKPSYSGHARLRAGNRTQAKERNVPLETTLHMAKQKRSVQHHDPNALSSITNLRI